MRDRVAVCGYDRIPHPRHGYVGNESTVAVIDEEPSGWGGWNPIIRDIDQRRDHMLNPPILFRNHQVLEIMFESTGFWIRRVAHTRRCGCRLTGQIHMDFQHPCRGFLGGSQLG
jgi:hypothetical protein